MLCIHVETGFRHMQASLDCLAEASEIDARAEAPRNESMVRIEGCSLNQLFQQHQLDEFRRHRTRCRQRRCSVQVRTGPQVPRVLVGHREREAACLLGIELQGLGNHRANLAGPVSKKIDVRSAYLSVAFWIWHARQGDRNWHKKPIACALPLCQLLRNFFDRHIKT